MRHIAHVGAVFVFLFVVILIPIRSARSPIVHNSDWTPVRGSIHGIELVYVPEGCFYWGSIGQNRACVEHPFWIATHHVLNQEFNQFVQAVNSGYRMNLRSDTTGLSSWYEAYDYCAEYGMRLPNFAELVFTAMGPDSQLSNDGRWVGTSDIGWSEWTARGVAVREEYDYETWYPLADDRAQRKHSFRCVFAANDVQKSERRKYDGYYPPTAYPTNFNPE